MQATGPLPRSVRHPRGFTLPELLVGSLLLSLFTMLALGAIVPALKVLLDAEESIASQREIVLAFDRLVAEMGMADRASLTVVPQALGFASALPYRGNNPPLADDEMLDLNFSSPERVWRKNIVLRQRGNQLWRREFPFSKGQDLYQILPDKLPLIADSPGRQEKIFAKNVEFFEATTAGSTRVRLRVRCVFRDSRRPASSELDLQIQMRGGM